jgi:hypothetical protein
MQNKINDIKAINFAAKSLHDFFRSFKKELSRPDGKKCFGMLKGIIEGKTVQLSEAGRHAEPAITPKTYCTKISGLLESVEFIADIQLKKSKKKKFKYFILDESDIQKTYARKIEVEKVRDGSTGNNNGKGYGLICVVGVTDEGEYVPLILSRYTSIGLAKMEAIKTIVKTFGSDHGAVWLMDRGYDDSKIFNLLLDEKQEFLIRLDRQGGQRSLYVNDPEEKDEHERYPVSMLTGHMKKVGYRKVRLPKREEGLTLVHYDHGKEEPLALLTTLSVRTKKQAEKTAKKFLNRWKIEDYFRFIKQRFELEGMMIHTTKRVDGLLAVVLVASAFVMEQTHKITKSPLGACYKVWQKKERCDLNWSSVNRFYRYLFHDWNLTLRTTFKPPDPCQLALFSC